uniref:LisH domain-containing protein n=1 Tax=Romanomermis culicivorax TaxID=13658 RepID=A0A915IB02_ROMCU
MYSKKNPMNTSAPSPSEQQARDKLALYVYEYLQYMGAPNSAESFLEEIRWTKSRNITLGDKPGFLQSWWCKSLFSIAKDGVPSQNVFWDLYCAAPERRDTSGHSPEAKIFQDFTCVANGMHGPTATPSPVAMPAPDGMTAGPAGMGPPTHFFQPGHMRPSPPQQPVSQQSPHAMMTPTGFLPARYPSGPRSVMRMPQDQPPYGSPGPQMYSDQIRLTGPQMMPQHRLTHGRMPPMNQNNFPMRPLVNTSMGPGIASGANMNRWPPTMQYNDPGPSQFSVSAMSVNNGPPPGSLTPMRSPHSMPDVASDRYGMMQPGAPPMGAFTMASDQPGAVGLGDMLMNGDGMDIKNSPASTHGLNGTPGPGPVSVGGASQGPSNGGGGGNLSAGAGGNSGNSGGGPGGQSNNGPNSGSNNGNGGSSGPVGGPNSAPPPVGASDACPLDYGGAGGPGGGVMHPFQAGNSSLFPDHYTAPCSYHMAIPEQEAEIQKIKDSISEESKTFLSKDRQSTDSTDYFNMR